MIDDERPGTPVDLEAFLPGDLGRQGGLDGESASRDEAPAHERVVLDAESGEDVPTDRLDVQDVAEEPLARGYR